MTGKIISAKEANRVFIDSVLNSSNGLNNRVGLVGYSTSVISGASHDLSNNNVSLKNTVNSWVAEGMTCICCGINGAVDRLRAQSNSSKYQSIVLMSDGIANVECSRQGVTGDLDADGINDTAKDDAIQAACDAYEDYNITVHAIAFGADADENTTKQIAFCGHGNFHSGGVEDLVGIYQQIAQDVINAAYSEQTIIGEGIFTKLYEGSYLKIGYTRNMPYGMIVISESNEFGNNISNGSFFVPNDAQVYEVQAVSYSGSKWTSLVEILNSTSGVWNSIFNLSEYNSSYTQLGDPYAVNIPVNFISNGTNQVRVRTGLGSSLDGGSEHNKIIYSLIKNISSFSPILYSANGCSWNIEFEDGTTESIDVPVNYTGNICYYNSSISGSYYNHSIFNDEDAINYAIYDLLSSLDLDNNGRVESKFQEQDLTITSIEITGIPFTWETEVQVRVWV